MAVNDKVIQTVVALGVLPSVVSRRMMTGGTTIASYRVGVDSQLRRLDLFTTSAGMTRSRRTYHERSIFQIRHAVRIASRDPRHVDLSVCDPRPRTRLRDVRSHVALSAR